MKKLLIICGATASGKSALAIKCAKKLNTEIISADSQLVYKGLNIGTAKPTVDEMEGVKHHLIDIVDARESFSVSDYEKYALPIIDNLLKEDKTPILCGGTGFYINSVIYNLGYGKAKADEAVREKYNKILEEKGKEYLFSLLKEVDPESAEILHINDVKRVIRALEIYEVTGKKKSLQNDELKPRYKYLAVAVDFDRQTLYERIDRRVDEMFKCGLVDEVKGLLASGVDEKCQCLQAIGYKEVVEGLKNGFNDSTMRDIIKLNTRHYAKRQITFFKKLNGIKWIKPDEAEPDKIMELLDEE
ncbi:MAG: tRNA (adenosine(37)-N6)-dimethylallyltransferase MiaA [Candidatus Coproplasma sp.]